MKNSFFNTINLSGEQLQRANARALSQEELIKQIFIANPDRMFSPSQIHEIFSKKYDLNPPITSLRRGLTNLSGGKKGCGFLIKTNEMVMGNFGLSEHKWAIREKAIDETEEWFRRYQNGEFDEKQPVTAKQAELF